MKIRYNVFDVKLSAADGIERIRTNYSLLYYIVQFEIFFFKEMHKKRTVVTN